MHQPQALGVSRSLREQGYALMCTSYPRSDAVLQCVEVRGFCPRPQTWALALLWPLLALVLPPMHADGSRHC